MSEELDFKKIMSKLLEEAEKDGKVSKEEEKFLAKLRKKVDKYQKQLSKAKGDDMINEYEFQDLLLLRDRILTEATNFETESDDINNLVQELFDEINQYSIPGQTDEEIPE